MINPMFSLVLIIHKTFRRVAVDFSVILNQKLRFLFLDFLLRFLELLSVAFCRSGSAQDILSNILASWTCVYFEN